MSEAERVVAAAEAAAAGSLWPTYALRAWLGALLVQTHQAETEAHRLIETHEREIDRLRAQIKRSGPVIKSLNDAIGMVDEVLRRKRDNETGHERSAQRAEAKKK